MSDINIRHNNIRDNDINDNDIDIDTDINANINVVCKRRLLTIDFRLIDCLRKTNNLFLEQ